MYPYIILAAFVVIGIGVLGCILQAARIWKELRKMDEDPEFKSHANDE